MLHFLNLGVFVILLYEFNETINYIYVFLAKKKNQLQILGLQGRLTVLLMYCVTVNLHCTPSHHPVIKQQFWRWHSKKLCTWPSAFCSFFGVNFCWFEFTEVCLSTVGFFCWNCLYIVTVLWWHLICYSPSSFKKSCACVHFYRNRRISWQKQKTKQKLLCAECWKTLHAWTSYSLCCSLLTPSQHMCLNEICTQKCICVHATCGPINYTYQHALVHAFSAGDVKILLFSLMFTFHSFLPQEEDFSSIRASLWN